VFDSRNDSIRRRRFGLRIRAIPFADRNERDERLARIEIDECRSKRICFAKTTRIRFCSTTRTNVSTSNERSNDDSRLFDFFVRDFATVRFAIRTRRSVRRVRRERPRNGRVDFAAARVSRRLKTRRGSKSDRSKSSRFNFETTRTTIRGYRIERRNAFRSSIRKANVDSSFRVRTLPPSLRARGSDVSLTRIAARNELMFEIPRRAFVLERSDFEFDRNGSSVY